MNKSEKLFTEPTPWREWLIFLLNAKDISVCDKRYDLQSKLISFLFLDACIQLFTYSCQFYLLNLPRFSFSTTTAQLQTFSNITFLDKAFYLMCLPKISVSIAYLKILDCVHHLPDWKSVIFPHRFHNETTQFLHLIKIPPQSVFAHFFPSISCYFLL